MVSHTQHTNTHKHTQTNPFFVFTLNSNAASHQSYSVLVTIHFRASVKSERHPFRSSIQFRLRFPFRFAIGVVAIAVVAIAVVAITVGKNAGSGMGILEGLTTAAVAAAVAAAVDVLVDVLVDAVAARS